MAAPRVPFNVTALNIEVPADGQREVTFSVATGVLDDTWTVEIAGTTVAEGDGTDSFVAVFPASADGQRWQLSHEGIERAAGWVIPRPLRNALDLTTLELTVDDGDTVVQLEVVAFGGADVHSALMVIDPTTDLTTFTTTDIIDPITWATVVSDLARGYLVGQIVAISSGANIGLYLVTASGPCTPLSPQPEIGEQIAVLVGGAEASPAVVIAVGDVAPTEYRGVKGVVRSVNGGTGAVVVDAASVGADPAGTAASAISALGLGTAATKNVPATGDASPTEVVQGDDSRLTDDRDPTSHDHAASEIVSGTVAAARLGSGTADSTTFLRGDSAWAAPPSGSPITEVRVPAVMFVGAGGQGTAPQLRAIGTSASRSRTGVLMADSATTSVWATMPWMPWTSVDVYLDLFNLNASTGGVRWQVYLGEQATTHAAMTAHLATLAVSAAASGDDTTYGTRWTTAVATSVAVTQSDLLSVSVSRLGADAADTLAGSVYFAALRFRQAGT